MRPVTDSISTQTLTNDGTQLELSSFTMASGRAGATLVLKDEQGTEGFSTFERGERNAEQFEIDLLRNWKSWGAEGVRAFANRFVAEAPILPTSIDVIASSTNLPTETLLNNDRDPVRHSINVRASAYANCILNGSILPGLKYLSALRQLEIEVVHPKLLTALNRAQNLEPAFAKLLQELWNEFPTRYRSTGEFYHLLSGTGGDDDELVVEVVEIEGIKPFFAKLQALVEGNVSNQPLRRAILSELRNYKDPLNYIQLYANENFKRQGFNISTPANLYKALTEGRLVEGLRAYYFDPNSHSSDIWTKRPAKQTMLLVSTDDTELVGQMRAHSEFLSHRRLLSEIAQELERTKGKQSASDSTNAKLMFPSAFTGMKPEFIPNGLRIPTFEEAIGIISMSGGFPALNRAKVSAGSKSTSSEIARMSVIEQYEFYSSVHGYSDSILKHASPVTIPDNVRAYRSGPSAPGAAPTHYDYFRSSSKPVGDARYATSMWCWSVTTFDVQYYSCRVDINVRWHTKVSDRIGAVLPGFVVTRSFILQYGSRTKEYQETLLGHRDDLDFDLLRRNSISFCVDPDGSVWVDELAKRLTIARHTESVGPKGVLTIARHGSGFYGKSPDCMEDFRKTLRPLLHHDYLPDQDPRNQAWIDGVFRKSHNS